MFDLVVILGADRRSLLRHLTPFFKRLAIIVNFESNGGKSDAYLNMWLINDISFVGLDVTFTRSKGYVIRVGAP
jgi:hypothetical protein